MDSASPITPTAQMFVVAYEVQREMRSLTSRLSKHEDVATAILNVDFLAADRTEPMISWSVDAYRPDGRVFVWHVDAKFEGGKWVIWSGMSKNVPDDPNGSIAVVRLDDRLAETDEGLFVELTAAASDVATIPMPD